MTLFDLTGKVCIVTGATKGIGRAIAERFAEHGAQVVVSSRHLDECDAVAAKINERWGGSRASGCEFDLGDRAAGHRLVAKTIERHGRVDVLVSNAAVVNYGAIAAASDVDFDTALSANVTNNALLAKEVAPMMRDRGGGSIIFTTSTLGLFPSPPFLTYSVSKAALAHLIRILAVDLGPANIRVNGLCPGIIKTAATEAMAANPEMTRRAIGKTPLGRLGEPDEIAAGAVLLAAPGGAYITGQLIVIDGGQLHQGREAARTVAEP